MAAALQRNHVTVSGSGKRALLFAHGFGCTQEDWKYVAPAFERDYRVVRYDLSGYGASARDAYDPEKHVSLQGHATDLIEIVRELEVNKVTFVGHSAGGMIGVLAGIREPALFERMALLGASPSYIDTPGYVGGNPREKIEGVLGFLESDYLAWCDAVVPSAMGNPERPELARELVATFKRANPEVAKHFGRAIFLSDYRTALPHLSVPTLVVQTSEDMFVPNSVGRFLAGHVQNGQFTQLHATGHYPQLSAPEEVIATLRTWLER